MDKQECTLDGLPLDVQEHIISYLPADNLYRVLWSRCYNASQKFYDAIAKAYLESHFVPQEFIDKAIAKDFVCFHGFTKQKQEFQEKIRRALNKYNQNDTQTFVRYKEAIKSNFDFVPPIPFDYQILQQQVKNLIYSTEDECMQILGQLRESGELTQVRRPLQKYRSCMECYRACLPLSRIKTMLLRAVTRKYVKEVSIYATVLFLAVVFWYMDFFLEYTNKGNVALTLTNLDKQQCQCTPINLLTKVLFMTNCAVYVSLLYCLGHYGPKAFKKLKSSLMFNDNLQAYAIEFKNLQAKISRALNSIDQFEKA